MICWSSPSSRPLNVSPGEIIKLKKAGYGLVEGRGARGVVLQCFYSTEGTRLASLEFTPLLLDTD